MSFEVLADLIVDMCILRIVILLFLRWTPHLGLYNCKVRQSVDKKILSFVSNFWALGVENKKR